jgi:hypothetical protein
MPQKPVITYSPGRYSGSDGSFIVSYVSQFVGQSYSVGVGRLPFGALFVE